MSRKAKDRTALESRIGYKFADKDLLERALTHISALAGGNRAASYQRLEFLGDHVLGLVISDMRLRNLRKLEEMEIRAEDKALREERTKLKALIGSPAQQWKTISGQIKEIREKFGPKTEIGKRRTTFGIAPAHGRFGCSPRSRFAQPILQK